MSAGTVMLNLSVDMRRFCHQLSGAGGAIRLAGVRLNSAFRRLNEREIARQELAIGRELQESGHGWDVQVVTTNEGRCRVVVRQLGGWS